MWREFHRFGQFYICTVITTLENVQQIGVVHLFALIIFQPATANNNTAAAAASAITHTHTHARKPRERACIQDNYESASKNTTKKKLEAQRERKKTSDASEKCLGVYGNLFLNFTHMLY